jgi:hypothetical protein
MYTNMMVRLATAEEVDALISRLPQMTTFQLRYPATIISKEELEWPLGLRSISPKSEIYASFETEELNEDRTQKVRRALRLPLSMDNNKECYGSRILRQGGMVHGYRLFSREWGEYLELTVEDQTAMERDWINGGIGVHVAIAFDGRSATWDELSCEVHNMINLYQKKYADMKSQFLQAAETPEMRERVLEAQHAYR